jgi:hypothetical protein
VSGCGDPIADDGGYVTMSYAELNAHKRATRVWDEEHAGQFAVTAGELLTYPETVRWRVLHADCDPEPDSPDYCVGVERIRTPAQVVSWAAQLGDKNWIQLTDWSGLLRNVASQLGSQQL